jgi:hypothetical protein
LGNIWQSFTITFFEDLSGNGAYDPATDNLLGTATQPSLPASGAATVSISIQDTLQFRDSLIYAFVDSQTVILETNEDNNYRHSGVQCPLAPPVSQLNPSLEWSWTGSTTASTSNQVMMMPVVADLMLDGVPDIIFVTFSPSTYDYNGRLRAITVDDRTMSSFAELFTVTDSSLDLVGTSSLAVGNLDSDPQLEIVGVAEENQGIYRLIIFNVSINPQTNEYVVSGTLGGVIPDPVQGGALTLANLDQNGTPEIVIGRTVADANGTILWTGTAGEGRNDAQPPISLVADLKFWQVTLHIAQTALFYGRIKVCLMATLPLQISTLILSLKLS